MGYVENFTELLTNSIKYGLSNKRSILTFGIIGLIAYLIFFIGYAIVILFEKDVLAWLFFAITSIPVLVLSVLFMGFAYRCLSELLHGNNVMPDVTGPGKMAVDGLKVLVVYIEAIVICLILFIPMMLALLLSSGRNMTALVIFCLLYPIELLLAIIVVMLNMVQWVVLADTGSLMKALNPLTPIRLIVKDFKNALLFAVLAVIIYVLWAVIIMVLTLPVCTIVLLPFTYIPAYCTGMYLLARFYQRATGRDIQAPPQPTA